MALKNWKKIYNNSKTGWITWKNKNIVIGMYKFKMDKEWVVHIKNEKQTPSFISTETFSTRIKALTSAKKYMRSH